MKEVILHIGTGKTGTSNIQDYLYRNRACLAKRCGLDYLDVGLRRVDHFGEIITAHYDIVDWIRAGDARKLERLAAAINRSAAAKVLLSCENFYHHFEKRHLESLRGILGDSRVRVICYVRRQDLYMESAYKQQVKVGEFKMPFAQFLRLHTTKEKLGQVHANYARMLRPWEDTFGLRALEVRAFERKSFRKGDLLADFLYVCGVPDALDRCGIPSNVHNVAFPKELIEVVRYFNSIGTVPAHLQQEFVDGLIAKGGFRDGPMLAYSDRTRILENYSEVNEELFRRYIEEGRSFDDDDLAGRRGDVVEVVDLNRALAKLVLAGWNRNSLDKSSIRDFLRRSKILLTGIRGCVEDSGLPSPGRLYLMIRLAFSRNFSPVYYLHSNPDVLSRGVNPLRHFIDYGFDEKRVPAPGIGEDVLASVSTLRDLLKLDIRR